MQDEMSGDGDNPAFVTLMPATHDRQCVAIMTWNYSDHEYTIRKCSQALQRNAAESLARSWAAAMKLEIR